LACLRLLECQVLVFSCLGLLLLAAQPRPQHHPQALLLAELLAARLAQVTGSQLA
jgi:hypothetical protein